MWVEAVLAVPDGTSVADDVADDAADALRPAGWGDPATAVQPVPGADDDARPADAVGGRDVRRPPGRRRARRCVAVRRGLHQWRRRRR